MTTKCYITIHSTDLIRECEERQQFAAFHHPIYMFVGPRPINDMPDVDVIVCRNLRDNVEHLPQFYDYTGWWALVANGLIDPDDHIITMQYDMHVIDPTIEQAVDEQLDAEPGMIAFNAGYYGPNWMLRIPGFEAHYRGALWQHQRINPDDFPPFNEWPSTQGTAWRGRDFIDYMVWFRPFFDAFQDSIWSGHLSERTVKAWSVVNHPESYMLGMIRHEAADLHGTGALMAGNQALYEERNAAFMGH